MMDTIPLHMAVANRCLEEVKSLLNQGVDIDAQSRTGQTALHLAIKNNFGGLVKLLLERGTHVNVKDFEGNTPLHCAISVKNEKLVRQLLNKGAQTEDRNDYGQTPLHMAAMLKECKIIDSLLEKGANIESLDSHGRTPLQILLGRKFGISENEWNDVVALLRIRNKINETPLHMAVRGSCVNLVRIFLQKGAEIDNKDTIGRSALHIAIKNNCESLVSILLEFGADVNITNEKGMSPIHCALLNRNVTIMTELLYKEADIQNTTHNGEQILLIAVKKDFEPEVSLLLKWGAEANVRSESGEHPLHCALINRNIKIMAELLDKGADIESEDECDETPLYVTAKNSFVPEFELLLNRNANFNSRNSEYSTLEHVVLKQKFDLFKKLFDKGADMNILDYNNQSIFFTMVQKNFEEAVELVLESGVKIIMNDRDGRSPLHIGCTSDRIVDMLLAYGVDIESMDNYNQAPLLSVIKLKRNGFEDAVQVLLQKGANIKVTDGEGKTVLHYPNISNTLLVFLLSNGADPKAKDNNGQTPLHVFVDSFENFEILLAKGADLDLEDNNGVTPLMSLAVSKLTVDADERETKTIISATDQDGETLLHMAASFACENLVLKLLEKEADVHFKDESNSTPLHCAVLGGNCKIVEEFINRGAPIDVQNRRGKTPLHLAVEHGTAEVIEDLLVRGARLDIKDSDSLTPLEVGESWDDENGPYQNIIKHIVKLKVANLEQNLTCQFDSIDYSGFDDYKGSCEGELEKIKMDKFGSISLFCLFSEFKDPIFSSNSALEERIKSHTLKYDYPIYASLLKVMFEKAVKRNFLLDTVEFNVNIRLDNMYTVIQLPDEIKRKILSELTNNDLISLMEANKLVGENTHL